MSENSLEARIDRVEQIAALQKLINTYHWEADHFHWEEWANTFTDDAVFDLPNSFGLLVGRKQIHDQCKANMDHVYDEMQHIMVNLDFELLGSDAATGHANLVFTGVPDRNKPNQAYTSGGRYTWTFRKTSDGWRIAKAHLVFLWNIGNDNESVFDAGKK